MFFIKSLHAPYTHKHRNHGDYGNQGERVSEEYNTRQNGDNGCEIAEDNYLRHGRICNGVVKKRVAENGCADGEIKHRENEISTAERTDKRARVASVFDNGKACVENRRHQQHYKGALINRELVGDAAAYNTVGRARNNGNEEAEKAEEINASAAVFGKGYDYNAPLTINE